MKGLKYVATLSKSEIAGKSIVGVDGLAKHIRRHGHKTPCTRAAEDYWNYDYMACCVIATWLDAMGEDNFDLYDIKK